MTLSTISPNGFVLTIAVLGAIAWLVMASVQNARKQKLASAELGRVAKEGLLKMNLSPEDFAEDSKVIDDYVKTGLNPHDQIVLRNFAAHTGRHRVEDIEATSIGLILAGVPNPSQLTNEHIIVHRGIEDALMDTDIFRAGSEGNDADEQLAVSNYAMNHIEDGYKILSLITDRRYGTLAEIIDGLSMFKDSEPGVLATGTL